MFSELLIQNEKLTIHEQAERYLACDALLNDYSLGKSCLCDKLIIDEAVSILLKWHSNKVITKKNPIFLIFNSMKQIVPLYLYDSLLQHEAIVLEYIHDEISMFPEVDYSMSTKVFVKMLITWTQVNNNKTLLTICSTMIRHKMIMGFLKFLKNEFKSAITDFAWALDCFFKIEKKFKSFLDQTEYLSHSTKRIIVLLLNRCYNLGAIHCNKKQLAKLFTNLVDDTYTGSVSELSSGRLGSFFIACGYIYEKLAFDQKYQITIETKDNKIEYAIRYDKKNLEEMIRKYIIASTTFAEDDPSDIDLYDRIIWGLLLYGGVHVKTLWFFILIRNFFFIDHDFGPIQVDETHKYKLFNEKDLLSKYENGWRLFDKIYEIVSEFTIEEEEEKWDPRKGNELLLPQLFEKNSKLITVDSFYDECNSYSNNKVFIEKSDFEIKPKQKSHIKLQPKIIQEQFEISKIFVTLWIHSYTTYHNMLPGFVEDAFQEFLS